MVQALHAFARGGLLGTGSAAGLPEVGGRPPIPAVHTDFPLAALGEELGLVGVMAILGIYLVIVERGLRIAAAAADDFRALLAAGLALVIGVQAFIIAAGNLKLIPLTGITLPFISYGGSSLLANALVVGLLLALSDKRRRAAAAAAGPRRRAGAGRLLRRSGRPDARRTAVRRRPLGRGDGPRRAWSSLVAFALLAAGAGYWGVVRGAGARRARRTTPPSSRRRGPCRAAKIRDRTARPGQQQGGRERRALPRLRRAGRSARSSATRRGSTARAGLERAYDAELTGLAGDPSDATPSRSSAPTATTRRT